MKTRMGILFALGLMSACTYATASSAQEKPNTVREPPPRALWISANLPLLTVSSSPALLSKGANFDIGSDYLLRFGGQLSDHWLLGLNAGVSGQKGATPLLSQHNERFGLRIEYFRGMNSVRPFVALEPTYLSYSATTTTRADVRRYWDVGLSTGAHIFAARSISVDPYAAVEYFQGGPKNAGTFAVRIGLMLSAWYWR